MPILQPRPNKSTNCNCCGRKDIRKRVPWPLPGNELYVGFLCPYCDLNEPDPDAPVSTK